MLSQHLPLNTKVEWIRSGTTASTFAEHYDRGEGKYRVYLRSSEPANNYGFMDLVIRARKDDGQKIVFIDDMHNEYLGIIKHVGSALHEFAFRLSIACGAEGRVELDAVRNSHYAHYVNGFRLRHQNSTRGKINEYYFKLAHTLVSRIPFVLGSEYDFTGDLVLPPSSIKANRAKFGLPDTHSTAEPSAIDEPIFKAIDKLLGEARAHTTVAKLIIGLHKGLIGFIRDETPVNSDDVPEFDPGEFCEHTENVLSHACTDLCKLLPLDSAEKQQQFVIVLTGALILAMLIQDAIYGTQERFDKQLLYPFQTLEQLKDQLNGVDKILLLSQHLGKSALIEKSIPFDIDWTAKVYGELGSLPEFKSLFDKYNLQKSDALTLSLR